MVARSIIGFGISWGAICGSFFLFILESARGCEPEHPPCGDEKCQIFQYLSLNKEIIPYFNSIPHPSIGTQTSASDLPMGTLAYLRKDELKKVLSFFSEKDLVKVHRLSHRFSDTAIKYLDAGYFLGDGIELIPEDKRNEINSLTVYRHLILPLKATAAVENFFKTHYQANLRRAPDFHHFFYAYWPERGKLVDQLKGMMQTLYPESLPRQYIAALIRWIHGENPTATTYPFLFRMLLRVIDINDNEPRRNIETVLAELENFAIQKKVPLISEMLAITYYRGIAVPQNFTKANYFTSLVEQVELTAAEKTHIHSPQLKKYGQLIKDIQPFFRPNPPPMTEPILTKMIALGTTQFATDQEALKCAQILIRRKRWEDALPFLLQLPENPWALRSLGTYYAKERKEGPHLDWALYFYQRAAQKEDPPSLTRLGQIYEEGLGIQKNEILAVEKYEAAAALNDPEGLTRAAIAYLRNIRNTLPEIDRAYGYLERARAFDYPRALTWLAKMHLEAPGRTKQNPELAKTYLKKSIEISQTSEDIEALTEAIALYENWFGSLSQT